jgi:hypothetical protein
VEAWEVLEGAQSVVQITAYFMGLKNLKSGLGYVQIKNG